MNKNDLPPSRTAEQFVVRFPDGMRDRITEAAKKNNRSMNAEIVARLQASFEPMAQSSEIEAIAADRDQQRALAEQFRFIADSADNIRTLLSAMLLGVVNELREAGLPVVQHEWVFGNLVEWLNEKDKRGAAFSILRLIDRSSPEVVETLRNFVSHLEDLDLVRKPITLVRGSAGDKPKPKRRTGSVNKVILVPNMGGDPSINYTPAGRDPGTIMAPKPPNKGPVRHVRDKPPK